MNQKLNDGTTSEIKLATTTKEKDLGVIIDNKLSFSEHVAYSTSRANRLCGLIRRSFSFLSEEIFVLLFKSLVRPLLEYGHCIWQPHEKGLCNEIENVQRRATKMLSHLKELSYPERLRRLKLPSLEFRRLRGDMIETFKYIHGYYDTERPNFEKANTNQLRGHSLKLHKKHCRRKIRSNFFANRVINTWNNLPEDVVTAPSINSFKSRLDSFWKDLPIIYNPTCQN